MSVCPPVCLSLCMFVRLYVHQFICYKHCQQMQQLYTFVTVQDVLVTGLDGLTTKVQSLEDKYVRFLYKKVAALEKCNPCNPQSGEHYYYKYIM